MTDRSDALHKDLIAPGRVAVVTGAASGIGLALVEEFASAGMNVVMADVEEPALRSAHQGLAVFGGRIDTAVVDVQQEEDLLRVREQTLARFGRVDVVCNNAGVSGPHDPVWAVTAGEWEWVLGVNLWGVINGLKAFMPVLLEQDAGYVVNTASIFGAFAGMRGPYGVSKHAVVALSEALYFDVVAAGAGVGVSVLCPGPVRTSISTSDRNRPEAVAGRSATTVGRASVERMSKLQEQGKEPRLVAQEVVEGIRQSKFYLLTSSNRNEAVIRRGEEIVAGGPPVPPFP